MTPVRYIRRGWERRWELRVAGGFDAAGPNDTLRALQLFEPHVLDQALSVGPRLRDVLASARWTQGLTSRPRVAVRARSATCRPVGARWVGRWPAPLRPSHRRVIIRT